MEHKLLIVDDDYAIRSFLEEALKDAGYDIEKADNGAAALKILESNKIDLIRVRSLLSFERKHI